MSSQPPAPPRCGRKGGATSAHAILSFPSFCSEMLSLYGKYYRLVSGIKPSAKLVKAKGKQVASSVSNGGLRRSRQQRSRRAQQSSSATEKVVRSGCKDTGMEVAPKKDNQIRNETTTIVDGKSCFWKWRRSRTKALSILDDEIFVCNLPYDTTEDWVRQVFGSFGEIESATVIRRPNRKGQIFGFVRFSSKAAAAQAVDSLHGFKMNGYILLVALARHRKSNPISHASGIEKQSVDFHKNVEDKQILGDNRSPDIAFPSSAAATSGDSSPQSTGGFVEQSISKIQFSNEEGSILKDSEESGNNIAPDSVLDPIHVDFDLVPKKSAYVIPGTAANSDTISSEVEDAARAGLGLQSGEFGPQPVSASSNHTDTVEVEVASGQDGFGPQGDGPDSILVQPNPIITQGGLGQSSQQVSMSDPIGDHRSSPYKEALLQPPKFKSPIKGRQSKQAPSRASIRQSKPPKFLEEYYTAHIKPTHSRSRERLVNPVDIEKQILQSQAAHNSYRSSCLQIQAAQLAHAAKAFDDPNLTSEGEEWVTDG